MRAATRWLTRLSSATSTCIPLPGVVRAAAAGVIVAPDDGSIGAILVDNAEEVVFARAGAGSVGTADAAGAAVTRNGIVMANVLPWPTTLVTSIDPFINSASWRLIASPSPVPPNRRVVEAS